MIKRGCLFFWIVFISFSINFVSASISVRNFTLQDEYSPYEIVVGEINLTLVSEPLDKYLSSNLGQSIFLKEFLDRNDALENCSPIDCEDRYVKLGSCSKSKILYHDGNNKSYFGFYLTGDNVVVSNLKFNLSSDFREAISVPLKLELFEGSDWAFLDYSDNYTRSESRGCYFSNAVLELGDIGPVEYCEKVNIPTTNSVSVGLLMQNETADDKDLEMTIYNLFLYEEGGCTFNPFDGDDCIVDVEIDGGDYYVCVRASEVTDYKIFSEVYGKNCGWLKSDIGFINSTRDFGIFARTPKYASARGILVDKDNPIDDFQFVVDNVNSFLLEKYGKDCSGGCVLPVSFEGVPQNLMISNVVLTYSTSLVRTDNNVCVVDVVAPTADFSGVLDLAETYFNVSSSGTKNFSLYLGSQKLFEKQINVLPAPIISYVYPVNPPAGVPVVFRAVVSGSNISSYVWNFGDKHTETTVNNSVVHIYEVLGGYTLTLNVTDVNGFKTSKSFSIIAGSPQATINQTLTRKKNALNSVIRNINTFPSWQQDILEEIVNISFYQSELGRIERQWNNSVTEQNFLDVALELQSLDVPYSVYVSQTFIWPLITNLEDINPEPVRLIAGGSLDNLSDFKNSIFQWQKKNVNATITNKKISLVKDSGERGIILNSYGFDLKSNFDGESYLVIDVPIEDLTFKEFSGTTIKKADDFTVVILSENENKIFEFYLEGDEDIVFYASPKLSLLPIGEVDVCEGEECEISFPWGKVIFWIVVTLFGVLVVYTLLQMWYKVRYEKFLFKDRNHLFNLVMFITNARARGKSDSEIRAMLKNKGWSGEQVAYALKKSRGERTGMFEIIPIERMFAYFRNKKAKQNIASNRQGIDVSGKPAINRW